MRAKEGSAGAGEPNPEALGLLERFGAQMLATARRYSASPHDAEDAYQRAAEILLTHRPTGSDDELCRWLRTTTKHEALAIGRHRRRVVPAGEPESVPEPAGGAPDAHDQAERFERLRLGAQALGQLKPQEVRCLLLRAEGYSYQEICEATGFSYTKVNRCLTEGRRSFLERMQGIESGAECERLAPQLSALADREAGAGELGAVRAHLSTCLACRARLREFREVPSQVAALVPPAALVATGEGHGGALRSIVESIVGATQHKAAAIGERAHGAIEMASGQKVAAVAASAAALAGGGGAAVDRLAEREAGAAPVAKAERVKGEPPPAPVPAPDPTPPPAPKPAATQTGTTAKAATPPPAPPPPDPAAEFAPAAAPPPAPAAPAPSATSAPSGGGAGEFSP